MNARPPHLWRGRLVGLLSDYGMLGVLVILGIFFSILTVADQYPTGADGAAAVAESLAARDVSAQDVLIVGRATHEDSLFVAHLRSLLESRGLRVAGALLGDPFAIRERLGQGASAAVVAAPAALRSILEGLRQGAPEPAALTLVTPAPSRWPTFLLADNLRNVANQIAVIAIIAIGMTMVIIAGGIDLSAGSLIALSAVLTAWFIEALGGNAASTGGMIFASLGAIVVCGLAGAFSAWMITGFRIPPFIATLAMMQVGAGVAYIISQGLPLYQIPDGFIWLGRGTEPLLRIPNAVLLMIALYAIAHLVMTRTVFGRYIYAVGGNPEAARLAGVRVHRVQYAVYTLCGALAGLGGVIMASQLKSGAPTYGAGYELNVIAAVVVGGASLSGGEGRVLGTLIGALVIGVIQNGMNLTNVESYTQKVVLGLVILAAVLIDQLKHRGMARGWRFLRRPTVASERDKS
ncbi:MAG TPA: ABC transporter permease [bacterium]|nr:ABC transporter permease [bacterium]